MCVVCVCTELMFFSNAWNRREMLLSLGQDPTAFRHLSRHVPSPWAFHHPAPRPRPATGWHEGHRSSGARPRASVDRGTSSGLSGPVCPSVLGPLRSPARGSGRPHEASCLSTSPAEQSQVRGERAAGADRWHLSLQRPPRESQGPGRGRATWRTAVRSGARLHPLLLLPKVRLPGESWGSLVPSRLRAQQEAGQAGSSRCGPARPDWGEREGRAHGFHRGNPSDRGRSQKNYAPLQVPRSTAKDS